MPEPPLISSKQLIKALERDGWMRGRAPDGSHQSYVKRFPDGRKRSVTVVEGKREIPRGSTLSRAGLTVEDLNRLLD